MENLKYSIDENGTMREHYQRLYGFEYQDLVSDIKTDEINSIWKVIQRKNEIETEKLPPFGQIKLEQPEIKEHSIFKKKKKPKKTHKNTFDQDKGINILSLVSQIHESTIIKYDDTQNLYNLGGLLAPSKSDKLVFYSTEFSVLLHTLLIDFLRVLLLIPAINYLYINMPVNFKYVSCNFQALKSLTELKTKMTCDSLGFDITIALLNGLCILSIIFISCVIIYDASMAGKGLVGFQTYSERMKLAQFADKAGLPYFFGLYTFRVLFWAVFMVSFDYNEKGVDLETDNTLFFTGFVNFLTTMTFKERLQYLYSKDSIFMCILIYTFCMIYAKIKSKIPPYTGHPWTEPLDRVKKPFKEKIDPKKWTKPAAMVLSLNTILICTTVAMNISKIFDNIDENYKFDYAASHVYMLICLILFVIAFLIVRRVLSKLDAHETSPVFLLFYPIVIYCVCATALTYHESKVIQTSLLIVVIVDLCLNIAYIFLFWPIRTFIDVIEYLKWQFLSKEGLATILSFAMCLFSIAGCVFAFKSFEDPWFEEKIEFCNGVTLTVEQQRYVTLVGSFTDTEALKSWSRIAQYLMMIIPSFTGIFVAFYILIDRKSLISRSAHFWGSILFFILNLINFINLDTIENILSKEFDLGYVYIKFVKIGFNDAELSHIFMFVAMGCHILTVLFGPKTLNVVAHPLRNPTMKFTIESENEEFDEEQLSELELLAKEEKNENKCEKKFGLSWLIPLSFHILAIICLTYAYNNPWMAVKNEEFYGDATSFTELGDPKPNLNPPIGSTLANSLVKGIGDFVSAQNSLASHEILNEEMVPEQNWRISLTISTFFSFFTVLFGFIISCCRSKYIARHIVAGLCIAFILPQLICLIMLPPIIDSLFSGFPLILLSIHLKDGFYWAFGSIVIVLFTSFALLLEQFFTLDIPKFIKNQKVKQD